MSALLERDELLYEIGGALRSAGAERGGLVIVEGPPGIGKTALLEQGQAIAVEGGLRVLAGRGGELEREWPFAVARQLFEPLLLRADAAERAELLDGAAGIAGTLLGLPAAAPADPGGAPATDATFAILHGLYWLCVNAAAGGPLCLVVDDGHWVDAASMRFLVFLAGRLEGLGVVVLLARRPGETDPGADAWGLLATDPNAIVLRPRPLSDDAVALLVEAELGRAPAPAFVAACRRLTGGVPFLLRQVLGLAREDGIAPAADAVAWLEREGPRAAGRWVLVRLARLPRAAAELARAVAVLDSAPAPLAAELAGLELDEARDAADRLVAADVLAAGPELAFTRPMLREALYRELGEAERSRLHRRAADLLEGRSAPPEAVAQHELAAEPAARPEAVGRLRAAAAAASRVGANEAAASYLRRALDEPPAAGARDEVLLELATAEVQSGDPAGFRDLGAVLDGGAPLPLRFQAGLVLAQLHALREDFEATFALLDRLGGLLPPEDQAGRDRLEILAVTVAMVQEELAPAFAERMRAARARDGEDAGPVELVVAALLAALGNEPATVGAGLARRAIEALEAVPLKGPAEHGWLSGMAIVLVWTEHGADCEAVLETLIARARRTGDAGLLASSLAARAWLAVRAGDIAAAEADASTALDAALPSPPVVEATNRAILVEALVEQGELGRAEAVVAGGEGFLGKRSQFAAVLRLRRSRLLAARNRPEEALADALDAGKIALGTAAPSPGWLAWRSEAALLHRALGNEDEARRLAEEELALARTFGAPRTLGIALRAAGLVAADGGEAQLREAVETLAGHARLEHARALADLGALLRRNRRRAEARTLLTEAHGIAQALRATPLADRIAAELGATGARPRGVMRTGLASLTASERRVAELAASGQTNREIAQTLFVTPRTVEGHLAQVYAKLDVPGRGELPGALAGEVRG